MKKSENAVLYLNQLLAFNQACRVNTLDPSACFLYVCLLCYCFGTDKGDGWSCELTNEKLMELSMIGSLPRFYRFRKSLVDKGFLRYMSGRNGKPSRYRLLRLV